MKEAIRILEYEVRCRESEIKHPQYSIAGLDIEKAENDLDELRQSIAFLKAIDKLVSSSFVGEVFANKLLDSINDLNTFADSE